MAKATSKTPAKTAKKKSPPVRKSPSSDQIVKVCETSLALLFELDIEHELQSEINWCLGSFRNDNNPVGLYQMGERSLVVFKAELAKKTKGVTTKLIADIESALKNR